MWSLKKGSQSYSNQVDFLIKNGIEQDSQILIRALTPFAYAYLEELIRSTTSEYGIVALDEVGNIKKRRKVGVDLLNLAIKENKNNPELVSLLQKMKSYYIPSQLTDRGDNRHSVVHGYMHPRFWDKSSFEKLVHDIALISKHARF